MRFNFPSTDAHRGQFVATALTVGGTLLVLMNISSLFLSGLDGLAFWDKLFYIGMAMQLPGIFLIAAALLLTSFDESESQVVQATSVCLVFVGCLVAVLSLYGFGYTVVRLGDDLFEAPRMLLDFGSRTLIGLATAGGAVWLLFSGFEQPDKSAVA